MSAESLDCLEDSGHYGRKQLDLTNVPLSSLVELTSAAEKNQKWKPCMS